MKNNTIAKSKIIMISLIAAAAIVFIFIAVRFFGMPYYLYYFLDNADDIAEILFKLVIGIGVIAASIVLIKSMSSKFDDNAEDSKYDTNTVIKKDNKSKKTIIIIAAVSLVLLISLFIFSSRFFGVYYILHNLEDIFEVLFQLAITVVAICFLAVFFKKVWKKI